MKKIVKEVLAFNEEHGLAPRFALVYLLIWSVWHHQIFISVFSTTDELLAKVSSAQSALAESQYILVFVITCLLYMARTVFYLVKHKAQALLEGESISEYEIGSDLRVAKNADVERLLSVVADLKEQLADSKTREKKVLSDNLVITEALTAQRGQFDKLAAENALLKKAVKQQKALLDENRSIEVSALETV